jgi:hypothetical protein
MGASLWATAKAGYGVFERKPAPGLDPEMDTGSRKENASKQESKARSDSTKIERALALWLDGRAVRR